MGKNLEPQYAFRCDEETIKKLEYIAQQNTRTRNQEMKHVIKTYVAKYEQEHGEIQIEEILDKKKNTVLKIAKIVSGAAIGEAAADIVIKKTKKE
jgi:predicted DNA-binding protein